MRAVCSPLTPAAIFLCLFPFKTTRVVTCRNGDKIEKKEAKMESDMSSDSDSDFGMSKKMIQMKKLNE